MSQIEREIADGHRCWRKLLVLEVIIAAAVVVFVVGGLLFVLVLDRGRGSRPRWNAEVWWWSLVGLGLLGAAIAWITSAIV